jgi:restriction endonuclease S subunit
MREEMTLGDVLLDIQAGKSFQTAEVRARPDELGVIKVSAVTWSTFLPNEAKALKNTYVPDESHKVRKGDFLISRANTREFVGAVVLVDKGYPFRLLSDKTLRLVLNEDRVCKEYLLFALRAPRARKHIERFATGTSDSMRNISHRVIRTIPLRLPKIHEQVEIATRLTSQLREVENARRATERRRQEVNFLVTALYRDAYRNVVPVATPKSFGVAPSGWQWRKLTTLARLESGHTPSRSRPDWWGGEISWVSLTEIRGLDGTWVESTRIRTNETGIANSSARLLPPGTVCFSRTASVGFVTILAARMATSQDFANWVCGNDLDPEYLMYALIRSRAELRALATGATHKTIYMPTLESFHLCAPCRLEQEEIVLKLKEKLKAAEQSHAAVQQQAHEFNQLSQRVLAQEFET